jgi:hypothetical protein
MASGKKESKPKLTQAQRMLEVARKAKSEGSGNEFARATGKAALTKKARKATRIG